MASWSSLQLLLSQFCLNRLLRGSSVSQVRISRVKREDNYSFPFKTGQGGSAASVNVLTRTLTIDLTIIYVRTIKQVSKHLEKSLWGPVTCLCPRPQVGNTVWVQICVAIWYNLTPQRALGLTWELAEDGHLKICIFSPRHLPVSPACSRTHRNTIGSARLTYPEAPVHVWPHRDPVREKQSRPLTSVSQLLCNNHANTSNIWAIGALKEEYLGHLTVTPLQPWCALSSLYHLIWSL